EFSGNTDGTTVVSHDLVPPIAARYIRFQPLAWHWQIAMRVELYGCQGI
ncbi:Discoidin, CUB and LCCL domain-containing protein 1, partial [Stylophora pistillata]